MKKLTTNEYWVKEQGNHKFELEDGNLIECWITKNIQFNQINNVIEIGCVPGKFLTIFGKQGIEINGLDYIPQVNDLSSVFKNKGYTVGEFIEKDFLNYTPLKKYDCVTSFGFIEHFDEWEKVVLLHIDYMSKGGYIIIEVPNFRGFFQKIPRRIFDKNNFRLHNLQAMNLKKIVSLLENNGLEIISAEYFGGYELWFEGRTRFPNLRNNVVNLFSFIVRNFLFFLPKGHSSFSPVLGVIAKRT